MGFHVEGSLYTNFCSLAYSKPAEKSIFKVKIGIFRSTFGQLIFRGPPPNSGQVVLEEDTARLFISRLAFTADKKI